jgi:hypothetical protein
MKGEPVYDERRNRNIHTRQWIADQRYKFCWDSHLWAKGHTSDHTYTRCEWCGWRPPSEYPLTEETPLCPKNPDVMQLVGVEMEKMGNKLGHALRESFIKIK